MQYLAVRIKGEEFLFTQSRIERNNQNNVLIDEGKQIETNVVKSFEIFQDANKYCLDINSITGILKHLF